MTELEIDPLQFEGLIWSDCPDVPLKLGKAALSTPDKAQLVIDFDNCMTTDDLDSFGAVQKLQNEQGKERDKFLKSIFEPIYESGNMDDYKAVLWWDLTLRNLVGTLKEDIELVDIGKTGEAMEPREGLVEYFSLLDELRIPSVVMSAGIKNPIDAFLEKNGLRPRIVIANRIYRDEETGKIVYDSGDITHTYNKQEKAHGNGEIEALRKERPSIIIVGDGSKDPLMGGEDKTNIVSFCVGMPQDLTPEQQNRFLRQKLTIEGYDAVSLDGTFRPIHRATGALALHGRGTDLQLVGS